MILHELFLNLDPAALTTQAGVQIGDAINEGIAWAAAAAFRILGFIFVISVITYFIWTRD